MIDVNQEDFGQQRRKQKKNQKRSEFIKLFSPKEETLDSDSKSCCVYSGSSMNPTLREGDLLEVRGYGGEPIGVGDIILFKKEFGDSIVVHRVIRLNDRGLVTRGDNNLEEDAGFLDANEVIGKVVAAWRGQSRREVFGGRIGMIMARFNRPKTKLISIWIDFLAPFYWFVASRGLLRGLSFLAEPKIVRFGDRDLRLILGSREIGRYREGCGWLIKPPFKLIIDISSLPQAEVALPDDLRR